MNDTYRPYPAPTSRWIMRQSWHDLCFMHWPVPAEALRPHIPAGLEIDTFEGQAWIAVVPFRMSDVVPRGLFAVPGLSAFPELNVRTYVIRDGRPGVWFFSLDAGNRLAVAIARQWFMLPYFYARMSLAASLSDGIHYISQRIHPNAPKAEFVAQYRPTHAPLLDCQIPPQLGFPQSRADLDLGYQSQAVARLTAIGQRPAKDANAPNVLGAPPHALPNY